MKYPTFDSAGYPTEETLEAVEKWDYLDSLGVFKYIEEAWSYPQYWNRKGNIISISTGGWSGNESLISALRANHMIWVFTWVSSRRGGHFEFEVKE